MASIGTISAKVLLQIGDGEPIEVGVMDIDLTPKQKPVMRGAEVNLSASVELDTEATAKTVARRLASLQM